jgi:WD40 repeat protein
MSSKLQINKIAQLTGHNASIFAVVSEENAQYFLSGAGDGWIVRWDFEAPELGKLIAKVDTQIFSLLYLSETQKVVVGNMNGGVHWVDLNDPENTKNILHHKLGVFAIQQIGEAVYTLGGGGMLSRWNAKTGRAEESLHLTNQSLRCMDYSPLRNELAIGASDHNIYLLDKDSFAIKKVIEKAHENSVFTLKYSPNQTKLLSGGRDAHLRIWDIEQNFAPLSAQPAHWYTINDIIFHPEGHLFATASRDKTIKIWDSQTFELQKVIEGVRDEGHLNSVNGLFWSTYQNYLVSCSDDRSMIIWDIEMG